MVNPDAVRGQVLLEESREAVVVLDEDGVVVAASRRARQSLGRPRGRRSSSPELLAERARARRPVRRRRPAERLVYLSEAGDLAAYEELRSGFTAAVSHELRTPLARLLSLLELAGAARRGRARSSSSRRAREVEQIRELIDEVLFLAELESGTRVVSLGAEPVLPVLREVAAELEEQAARAGVALRVEGDEDATAEVRPRMLRVVAQNLAENAIRYAGPGHERDALGATRGRRRRACGVVDDGAGVDEADLPRLFERFYRADRSRASRGTGLGLAIVKHVVASAGGTVEARGGRGRGLEIRCSFPTRRSPFTTLSPDLHHPAPHAAAGRRKTRRMTNNDENDHENCAAARPARPARRLRRRARRRRRRERDDDRGAPAAATSPAASRRTAPAPSARTRPRRPSASSSENPDVQVTVGVSGTGGGFERFCRGETDLSNASRPIKDEEATALRGQGHRVRRVPGRERRAHRRRQQGQRLGRRASRPSS